MKTLKRIGSWVKLEKQRSNKNQLSILCKMALDYSKYGVNPKEYYYFNFAEKTKVQKQTFLQKRCSASF